MAGGSGEIQTRDQLIKNNIKVLTGPLQHKVSLNIIKSISWVLDTPS